MSLVPALIAAALLTVASKAPLAVAQSRANGGYDNVHPRAQQSALTGWGARALAAHQNSMEAFPMLGVGAAIALGSGHDGAVAATLVWAWVAIRVAFIAAYVAGAGKLRTLTYSAALGCALALYTLPIIG